MNISIQTKIKMVKFYVCTFLLYGCESSIVDKGKERIINAAEVRRFFLRIPGTDTVTCRHVLRWASVEKRTVENLEEKTDAVPGTWLHKR